MNRIPVGETTRFAYRFTLGELGTIIGLIWVPTLATAILRFLPYLLGDNAPPPDINPSAAGAIALRGLLLALVGILLKACADVPVTRQALGLRTGPAWIHFAIGRTELRLWGAYLLIIVIMLLLGLGVVLATTVLVVAASAAASSMVTGAAALLLALIGACAVLYAAVRLGFLLAPVAVAESTFGFERGWILTRGNFWRIAAVLFLVTLPAFVVLMIASWSLMGREMSALVATASHGMTLQDFLERYRAIVDSHISSILGVQLIIAPFNVGLTLGAAAHAYKVLSTSTPVPLPTPQP